MFSLMFGIKILKSYGEWNGIYWKLVRGELRKILAKSYKMSVSRKGAFAL